MTTVINYNFFGINSDAIFGDFGLKNRPSDKNQGHSPKQQRTIDITAQSRVLDEDDNNIRREIKKHRMAEGFTGPYSILSTYDRQGRPVQLFDSKGLYVDCRV